MGTVYKAEDKELGTIVALKMIRPELSSRPHVIAQFKKETLLGRTITHENVVRIHDLGEVDKIKYISMDYIKGENLLELIQTSGTLTLATCINLTGQICQALKAAHHKGIIHQDLKPQNVMVDNSGKVYVMDFGLAKSLAMAGDRPAKTVFGTPRYFSPEQASGEEVDQRSDIYSLGAIMYEMITGTPPFLADTIDGYIHKHLFERPSPPSKINPAIPPSCEKIILKCLEKKKENRYQNIEAVLLDLESKTKDSQAFIAARVRPKNWPKIVFAAAAILILILGYYFLRHSRPSPSQPQRNLVAIMYSVNNSEDKIQDKWLRWGITDLLTTQLGQSKYLSVFPEDQLMQILENMGGLEEEQHLSKTLDNIVDMENVEYFVLPSFTKTGSGLRIDLKVRKAGAKELMGTAFVQGKGTEDLLPMVDQLGLKVRSIFNLSPTDIAGDFNQRLDQITTSSPEALRYYVEGEQYFAQGDFEASIQSLEKAVEEDPNYAMAYEVMSEVYSYLGDYDKTKEFLKKTLDLVDRVSERDRYAIQGYAAIIMEESPQPALKSYEKLIEFFPVDESGYVHLASIYRNLEEWDKAIDLYEKLLQINSRSMFAYDNLAFIYRSQGLYEKAADIIQAATKIFPKQALFSLNEQLAWILLVQGRYDQAAVEIDNIRAFSPEKSRFPELEGNIFQLRGDLESAAAKYSQLQQKEERDLRPKSFLGRLWTAYLHLQQGQYRQSQEDILKGIEMAQKSKRIFDELEFRILFAYSEFQLGRFPGVVEALKPTVEMFRQVPALKSAPKYALVLSGMAELGRGQVEEAKKIAKNIRELIDIKGPQKHLRYYDYLLGWIALAEKRPADAAGYFEQAISLLPAQRDNVDEQAFYYDGLAAARYQGGDYAKAKEAYQRVISMTTGRLRWGDIYARAFYWLGKISQKEGNVREARAHYEMFLKIWENADGGMPEAVDATTQLAALKSP